MFPWYAVFLAFAVAADAATTGSQLSRISVRGRFFVDEYGRTNLFHGFNDVGDETNRKGQFDGSNHLPQLLISNKTRLEVLTNEYGFKLLPHRSDIGSGAARAKCCG